MGPRAVCMDGLGNTYICEREGNGVRKVDAQGILSTIAGAEAVRGYTGDGGPALAATWGAPKAMRCDLQNNLSWWTARTTPSAGLTRAPARHHDCRWPCRRRRRWRLSHRRRSRPTARLRHRHGRESLYRRHPQPPRARGGVIAGARLVDQVLIRRARELSLKGAHPVAGTLAMPTSGPRAGFVVSDTGG